LICRKPAEHLARNPDRAFILPNPAGKALAGFAYHHFADDYQLFRSILENGRALSETATEMKRGNLSERHRTISPLKPTGLY